MDDLAKIRAFVETVNRKGFTAAARQADVAVSSIARQVRALEDDLGIRLLNRTTRSHSLTEAGRLYYDRMRILLEYLDAAKRDVFAMQTNVSGVLKVTIRYSTSGIILPALLDFHRLYPDLVIDISMTDERLDLVAEGIDVAVWLGAMEDSSLIGRRLCPSRRVICGSPDYFALHGIPKSPEDLQNHNCLVFRASHYTNSWRFSRGDEIVEVPVRGSLRSATGNVLLEGAVAGLGLVLIQEFTARAALASGKLQTVFDDFNISPTQDDTSLYVVYPSSKGLPPAVRAFVDFLVKLFNPMEHKL